MTIYSRSTLRQKLWYEQDGKCLYCLIKLKSYMSEDCCLDHIYPKSRGGNNHIENISLVCYPCNAVKSDFVSISEVFFHFIKMFRLFWRFYEIKKVQKAIKDGTINSTNYERKKLPNIISKVGTPPAQLRDSSLRVKAYERKLAAFHRLNGTSARRSIGS